MGAPTLSNTHFPRPRQVMVSPADTGLSGFTQEDIVQMTLFEDPKMEYYRKWDLEYDEKMSASEDARLLAYERAVPKDEAPGR